MSLPLMYVALISGRKITEKMSLQVIDRLIKANSPEEIFKRDEWVEKVTTKLSMVSNLISETDWSDKYRADTDRFVNSLIKYAKSRKTLSKKTNVC